MNRRAIGIDIGTSTLCGCVLDAAAGRILAVETLPNRGALPGAAPYAHLQDPGPILADAEALFQKLDEGFGPVAGVGLSGQMHGMLYLDAKGRPLSPLATWQDQRAAQAYGGPNESYAEAITARTGHPMAAGYGAASFFYDSENRKVPEGAAVFCTIGDALALRLARAARPVLHPTNAAGLGLFLPEQNRFDEKAIEGLGLDAALFPAVQAGDTPLGATPDGAPVFPCLGDNQAAFLGSVREAERTLLVNMGTGGQIVCRTAKAVQAPGTEARPFLDKDYLWAGASLCGGRAYALLESFFRQVAQGAGAQPAGLYPWMDKLAEAAFSLREPLVVDTRFSGTRAQPALRGSIQNLGAENFTPAHLVAGVLQGTVDELVELYKNALPMLGTKPDRLVGAGGGLRKSAAWRALFSHALGMPMQLPAHEEEAAFGAALYALKGAGVFQSFAQAQKLVRYADNRFPSSR